ncbi:MAG: class II glutamine amidotransferase [Flavobacteriales bacterium]
MCRFLSYLGAPISMGELLYDPSDSIINQSYAAREIEEPLNGDGFGVGWYHRDSSPDPAVFVSVTPAWNNRNLRSLAPKLRSHCIAAHVRAASVGGVAEANCHPFQFKERLMMHNGGVAHFDRIKRDLCNMLSEEIYTWVKGQTDSEHLFGLMLNHLKEEHPTPDKVADAFEAMIADLKKLMQKHAITEPAYMNMVYTDGRIAVGLRYVTDRSDPLTMYYSEGKKYICTDNVCRMVRGTNKQEHAAMIVSEKLTDIADDFIEVPPHHFVLVDADLTVKLRAVQ